MKAACAAAAARPPAHLRLAQVGDAMKRPPRRWIGVGDARAMIEQQPDQLGLQRFDA